MPAKMKNIIADTLYNMAKVKSIDKITVKALIEKCGISRQTFYYHFQDIMDVIEWSIKKNTEMLVEKSLKADNAKDAVKIFVASAVENYPLLKKLLESQRRDKVEALMVEAIRSYFHEMVKNKVGKVALSYDDMRAMLDFYSYGFAGLLFENCGRADLDQEEFSEQIYSILAGELFIKP